MKVLKNEIHEKHGWNWTEQKKVKCTPNGNLLQKMRHLGTKNNGSKYIAYELIKMDKARITLWSGKKARKNESIWNMVMNLMAHAPS